MRPRGPDAVSGSSATVLVMIVRAADENVAERLTAVYNGLLSASAPADAMDALSSPALAASMFWPPADGWTCISVETGPDDVDTLYVFEDAAGAVATTFIGSSAWPSDHEKTGVGWDDLSQPTRERHLHFTHHAHGSSRLDLLAAFADESVYFTTIDAVVARWVMESETIMDEVASTMVALGSYPRLVERVAAEVERQPVRSRAT